MTDYWIYLPNPCHDRRYSPKGCVGEYEYQILGPQPSVPRYLRVVHLWRGPLRAVHLSRHKWPGISRLGCICCPLSSQGYLAPSIGCSLPWYHPPTRWSATLSSLRSVHQKSTFPERTTIRSPKVNLPKSIHFRAVCGANLVTYPAEFRGVEARVLRRVGKDRFLQTVQGYLAHKKPPTRRTLQLEHA